MSKEIMDFAVARAIPFLFHFTRAANLASILQHGIVPVSQTAAMGVCAQTNDAHRLDHQPNANCVSIGFPNHRMFYKYRQADAAVDWVVLAINPSVLWTKPCAFCQRNAADALVTGIPINDRMTVAAISGMYQEIEGERAREEQKLKSFDPTHDQAEVLVFGLIEPNLIHGAAFNSDAAKTQYGPLLGTRELVKQGKNSGYFGSRSFSREH